MDPIIKRVLVDPPVKLAPKSVRLASTLGLAAFLAATLYAKVVSPRRMEADIARDMYAQAGGAGAAAAHHH